MKKMMLLAAACAMVAAPAVMLADTPVTSVNVVGYYSVTIPANGLGLVTPVLESFGSGNILDLDSNGQFPNGSAIYIWDRAASGYAIAQKSARGTWSGATTNLILRGDAVWIRPGGTNSTTLTFMGEVPGAYNSAGTTTLFGIDATDAVGYSYPIDVAFTNTSLYSLLPNNSALFVWDIATQGYLPFNKSARGAWNAEANSLVLKAGHAFWVRTPSPIDWMETVPYEL